MMKNTVIRKLVGVAVRHQIAENIIEEPYYYNDEPKFFSFIVTIRSAKSLTDGIPVETFKRCSAFERNSALIKTVGEVLERYSLCIYRKKNLTWASFNELKGKAVNPFKFPSFSKYRINPPFYVYENATQRLQWVKGKSLIDQKEIFIPAQLVYVPYRFEEEEPVVSFPITTGAALHDSLERAILTGLLEVIERDAFMVSYLNKLPRQKIWPISTKNKKLLYILEQLSKYRLELHLIDITTDIPVYAVLAILIDKTGLGPAVTLGIKAALDIEDAIIGAIEECFNARPWIREVMFKTKPKQIKTIKKTPRLIYTKRDRGLLWSSVDIIKRLCFFLNSTPKPLDIIASSHKTATNLNTLIKWFRSEGREIFYVDVTIPQLKSNNLHVVKVLAPSLQPLYLDDRFPIWNMKRLQSAPYAIGMKPAKQINDFPHPFL